MFGRDAGMAEAWLCSQEPLVRSAELGCTVDEVESLIKRHEAFQKAAVAWEERFSALEKLTAVRALGPGAPTPCPRPSFSFPEKTVLPFSLYQHLLSVELSAPYDTSFSSLHFPQGMRRPPSPLLLLVPTFFSDFSSPSFQFQTRAETFQLPPCPAPLK